jgi:endonuclease YncB( thermonuclease family)
MRVRNFAVSALVSAGLSLAIVTQLNASEKEWVTLNDCQYVESDNNDGDSFRARCGDKEFTARLYYADTPETNLVYPERVREQSVHFGITLDETLKIGEQAKERVRALLQKPFVLQTRWASAAGRARETRYNAIVEVDGRSLAEILVSEGLARAKGVVVKTPAGEKARDYMNRLATLEAETQAKRLGAWSRGATAASSPTATPIPEQPPPSESNSIAPAPLPKTATATPFGEYPANYKEIISAWMKTNRLDASHIDWQGEPKPADIAAQDGRHLHGYLVIFNTAENSQMKTRSVLIRDGAIINNSGF